MHRSTDWNTTQAYWDEKTARGEAMCGGVHVWLARAPRVGKLKVIELIFNPALNIYRIRESGKESRDMTHDEHELIQGKLESVARCARRVW